MIVQKCEKSNNEMVLDGFDNAKLDYDKEWRIVQVKNNSERYWFDLDNSDSSYRLKEEKLSIKDDSAYNVNY